MQIEQIKTALQEGLPFEIRTASRDNYRVEHPHQVGYHDDNKRVITVVTPDGLADFIQLLTITAISCVNRA
jgi:hypothetical protein